jgi:hypothetical protein
MEDSVHTTGAERALRVVLRLNGAITCLAIVAVFMPLEWMDRAHQALGLGPMPRGPVFEYLARTVSFLYVIHGVLCLLLSTDVRRFGPVITYVAVAEMAFAGLVFWIDRRAGMPWQWTWVEAPVIIAVSGLVLILRLAASRGDVR